MRNKFSRTSALALAFGSLAGAGVAMSSTASAMEPTHSYSLSQWSGSQGGGRAGGIYHSAYQVARASDGVNYANATTARISMINIQAVLDAYYGQHLTLDGIKGAATTNAIKSFQRSHHLSADGVVGAGTAKVLFSSNMAYGPHDALKIYTLN